MTASSAGAGASIDPPVPRRLPKPCMHAAGLAGADRWPAIMEQVGGTEFGHATGGGMAAMTISWGVVKQGVVVPNLPLPEGARVEIRIDYSVPGVPPELQEEFDAWDVASANALELVERSAEQGAQDDAE